MLERNHRLKVGEQGLVGYATSTGLSRVASDVGEDAVHFQIPCCRTLSLKPPSPCGLVNKSSVPWMYGPWFPTPLLMKI